MILLPDKESQLRALYLSYKHKLSHLSSVLPAITILNTIYRTKGMEDKVVLSNGHSGLALYCMLEKFFRIDAETLLLKHGIHPNRDTLDNIDCSTGSLGLGLPIAVGMALGTSSNIHCVISDGEMAEGSIWESLRFISDYKIKNIFVYAQINGYGAYTDIDLTSLIRRGNAFYKDIIWCYTDTNFTNNVDKFLYHYKVMEESDYLLLKKIINEKNIKTIII